MGAATEWIYDRVMTMPGFVPKPFDPMQNGCDPASGTAELRASDSATLVITPRLLPRVAAVLALCLMAICVSAIAGINSGLGFLNLLGMMLPAYVVFDSGIWRSYRLNENGIQIQGLSRPRFHARGELVSAGIVEGTLSRTLRLKFTGETVELEGYLLGDSLTEATEYVERHWNRGAKLLGMRQGFTRTH